MKLKGWVEIGWGTYTYTIAAVILILVWQLATTIRRFLSRSQIKKLPHRHTITTTTTTTIVVPPTPDDSPPPSLLRLSEIITDLDLKSLMDSLDGELHEVEKWDSVIDRTNDSFSYNAKCCKPKDGPQLYLSTTVFEGFSAEILRDFYMDNCYRKVWDKTLIEHEQLEVDESSGTEIGRMIKKFPLLTPREYILAWRLWEGSDGAYYCYSKDLVRIGDCAWKHFMCEGRGDESEEYLMVHSLWHRVIRNIFGVQRNAQESKSILVNWNLPITPCIFFALIFVFS